MSELIWKHAVEIEDADVVYAPGTWGPDEVERVTPPGGWQDPTGAESFAIAGQAA